MKLVLTLFAPILLLSAAVIGLAAWGLHAAAARSDQISVHRQTREVGLALSTAQDELAQSQTGVAIWDLAAAQLARPKPDWAWVDTNIGTWLSSVYTRRSDYILDGHDQPVYAMIARERVPPTSYLRIARDLQPLVDAVRGRVGRPANPHERLPGAALNPRASLKTSARAIHATDLALLDGRPAIVSVMRIIPDTSRQVGLAPLLVSVRYIDQGFLRELASEKMIDRARLAQTPATSEAERAIPLVSSRGQRLGFMIWHPELPGTALVRSLIPTAVPAVGLLIAMLVLLAIRLARTMASDVRTLELLNIAHAELQEREAQARHLAFHDPLTGLPNRALFNQMADRAFADRDPANPSAILILDLDRFKQVNDTLGHLGGDMLLEQVAERLSAIVRPPDIVARLGGDEFAVLVRHAQPTAIEDLKDAIVSAIAEPFLVLDTDVRIGTSVGASVHSDSMLRRTQIMREADLAMYRAKKLGWPTRQATIRRGLARAKSAQVTVAPPEHLAAGRSRQTPGST